MKRLSLALLALFASHSAIAEEPTGDFVEGWYVKAFSDGCSALAHYDGDTSFYVSYKQGPDDVVLFISDPKFKSLKDGEEHSFTTYFVRSKVMDDGWGDIKFHAVVSEDSKGLFSTRINGNDLLKDLATSDTIAFFKGERLVESFSLRGSAKMVAALRECARLVEKANPSDPLEG